MATIKYINIKEVVELTGHPTDEIRKLAQDGVLPAHKTRRGHWRLNVPDVEKYFGIQINKPSEVEEKPVSKTESAKDSKRVNEDKGARIQGIHLGGARLITENHYQKIFEHIFAAKSSIKIMTADFRLFRLKPISKKGKDKQGRTPFIKYLMKIAEQDISVQIICSDPTKNVKVIFEELYKKMNTDNFRIFFCIRNHAKVVIIDDKIAYLGSANVTPAGLGQGVLSPGNFEVGIMSDNSEIISSLNALFSKIMNGDYCEKCHRANKCTEY